MRWKLYGGIKSEVARVNVLEGSVKTVDTNKRNVSQSTISTALPPPIRRGRDIRENPDLVNREDGLALNPDIVRMAHIAGNIIDHSKVIRFRMVLLHHNL